MRMNTNVVFGLMAIGSVALIAGTIKEEIEIRRMTKTMLDLEKQKENMRKKAREMGLGI